MTAPLVSLAARRQQIADKQFLDLPVPRWNDPEVFVRYHLVDFSVVAKGLSAIERAPRNEKARVSLDKNADLLVNACEAVFGRIDGKDYSFDPAGPDSEFTQFDEALATSLGLPEEQRSARAVCRALFFSDGDLFAHANQLTTWLGYTNNEVDADFEGE